jgi:hypothetical protein
VSYSHLPHQTITDPSARRVFEHADYYLHDVYGMFRFLPPKDGDGGGGNFVIVLALLCIIDGLAREIWPGRLTMKDPEQRFKKLISDRLPWGTIQGKGKWLQKGIAADQLYCEFRNPLVHELASDKPAASRQVGYVEPIIGKWGDLPVDLHSIAEVDQMTEWNVAWPVLSEGGADENGKPRLKLVAAGLYWAVKHLAITLLDDHRAGRLQ